MAQYLVFVRWKGDDALFKKTNFLGSIWYKFLGKFFFTTKVIVLNVNEYKGEE